MISGDDYITAITARESDRQVRAAFHERVLQTLKPGSCVFDFGCGPGIDARFYAKQGFKVGAYDVDPRMCATFTQHCAQEIAAGQVVLFAGEYREFLMAQTLPLAGAVDLVTANFAPLSLVDEPHELFAKFHALTAVRAQVLISVLNPYFMGDAQYRWWWSNLSKLWRQGHYFVKGEQFNVFRRSPANFAAAAAPYFSLKAVFRGLPTSAGMTSRVGRVLLLSSLYMFLLFEKS